MLTFERIDQELKDARGYYGKAEAELKKWEEGEDDGQWLKKLKKNLRTLNTEIRKEKDEEKKKILEGDSKDLEEEIGELEKEKEKLEEEKDFWRGRVEKLQDGLLEYDKGKGNEQIA